MSPRALSRALPAMIVAAIVAATPLLVLWNVSVGAAVPRLHVEIGKHLTGAEVDNVQPPLSSFVNGDFQKFVAAAAVRALPARPFLTRVFNEINYSIFGHRRFGLVEVGAGGVLYESIYREEYCSRSLAEFEPRARRWAALLSEIQGSLAAMGKKFVYVITPSKIGVYPEYLGNVPCAAPEKDRLGLLPLYRRLLDEKGVHYVDAATLFAERRHDYEIDLWPRGGTHWMTLSASLAVNRFIDELNKQAGHRLLSNIKATYRIENNPSATDSDISDLLNLLVPRHDYPVFAATFQLSEPEFAQSCKAIKVGEVGGSFLSPFNDVLMTARCLTVYYHFYWNLALFKYSDGAPTNSIQPKDHDLLLDCDVIVLEENEQTLAKANHTLALHDFLTGPAANLRKGGASVEPRK